MRALTFLLPAALLAGCVAPTAVDPSGLPAALPGAVTGYLYACLAKADASEGPCLTRISRDDATLQEPFIATHPTNPDILAVGVNLGPPLAERIAGLPNDSHVCRFAIYVSEDGGGSWRETIAPPPPLKEGPLGRTPDACAGDPAIVFDAEGRMHVSGIASPGRASPGVPFSGVPDIEVPGDAIGFQVYYARSDDLGATWPVTVLPDDNGLPQDRNWMTLDPASGTLYVIWHNTDGAFADWTTELAWTQDGGASWTNQREDQWAPCGAMSTLALHEGQPVFTCLHVNDEGKPRVHVYALDPATGDLEMRSELVDTTGYGMLSALPDGRLALVHDRFGNDPKLTWSADGGRSWTSAVHLAHLVEGDWSTLIAMWSEADPDNAVHVLIQVARDEAPQPSNPAPRFSVAQTRHLVFDPQGGLAHAAILVETTAADSPRLKPAQALGDHFFGLAWNGERMAVAATSQEEILLTSILPQRPTG